MTLEVRFETPHRDLIQTFRALQAVSEAGIVVVIPEQEAPRWKYASTWFPFRFRIGSHAPAVPITIDHRTPAVTIGQFTVPLLFPHRAFDLYRAAWSDRTINASFAGKSSPSRRDWLRNWQTANSLRARSAWRRGDRDISIRFVKAGRSWPTKAWDAAYAEELGRSQFVLCPDGDFVWTYRFFEATAAGAVPIVESVSLLYREFSMSTITDIFEEQIWSPDAAYDNFERARKMLTAPADELREAVASLI